MALTNFDITRRSQTSIHSPKVKRIHWEMLWTETQIATWVENKTRIFSQVSQNFSTQRLSLEGHLRKMYMAMYNSFSNYSGRRWLPGQRIRMLRTWQVFRSWSPWPIRERRSIKINDLSRLYLSNYRVSTQINCQKLSQGKALWFKDNLIPFKGFTPQTVSRIKQV